MAGELSLTRTYDRVFSIVRDDVEPVIFDNVSARTATLYRMKDVGAIIKTGGKPHLRFTILKELPTASGYTDLDILTPVRGAPVTSCRYEWKQLQAPIQISGLDMIKTGDNAIMGLLEVFIMAAEVALRDALGGATYGIFSNVGESNLRAVTGFQNMFTTSTTTGTVGGLNRATLTVWRHQSGNVAGAFNTNGLNIMRTLFRQCRRQDEAVDTIVLNGATMDNFERELTSTFQVNLPLVGPGLERMIDAGFPNIRYKNAVMFDDDACPANYGYFLNLLKYIRLFVRIGRDAEIGDFVKGRTYDDLVSYVLWAGNMVNTALNRGGVLLNSDTY